MSPMMTSRGKLESGLPEASTHAVSQSDKNLELPKYISYSKKPSRFMVRHQEWQAKKKSPIYIHIPGRRRQASLHMGLLGRRPGFPKGGRGPRGRGGQRLWSLLGTFLPLVVRSHPRGRRMLRHTGGRLAHSSEKFRPAFVNQGPRLLGAHALRLRRAHIRRRQGRNLSILTLTSHVINLPLAFLFISNLTMH
jgi:hypothetical protein